MCDVALFCLLVLFRRSRRRIRRAFLVSCCDVCDVSVFVQDKEWGLGTGRKEAGFRCFVVLFVTLALFCLLVLFRRSRRRRRLWGRGKVGGGGGGVRVAVQVVEDDWNAFEACFVLFLFLLSRVIGRHLLLRVRGRWMRVCVRM